MHSLQRARCVLNLSRKLNVTFQVPGQSPARFVEGGQETGHVDSAHSRVGLNLTFFFPRLTDKPPVAFPPLPPPFTAVNKTSPDAPPNLADTFLIPTPPNA